MAHSENTQYMRVQEHLRKNRCITPMEAFSRYGITRLSAIIFDMRKDGEYIKTTIVRTKNRDGHNTQYAEYSLN